MVVTISQWANKSCKLDSLPPWLLKECVDVLAPCTTSIVNASIEENHVPKVLKQAHIQHFLKKHGLDEKVLKNYRPVSNLPFVSRILEKIISNRLSEHLGQINLVDVIQCAYRLLHSTETALLKE